MKEDQFSILIKKLLGDIFKKSGYKFADDGFFLNRSNGFRNVLSFDFDGNNSFRLFLGVDYPYDQEVDENSPPEGARLCCYYTGGSLSENPKDIFFKNESQLILHLERFKTYFERKIRTDFFDAVQTPEEYADGLPEVECIVKFEIYKNEKINDKALKEARIVVDSYENMLDIPKIKDFIDNNVKVFIAANS